MWTSFPEQRRVKGSESKLSMLEYDSIAAQGTLLRAVKTFHRFACWGVYAFISAKSEHCKWGNRDTEMTWVTHTAVLCFPCLFLGSWFVDPWRMLGEIRPLPVSISLADIWFVSNQKPFWIQRHPFPQQRIGPLWTLLWMESQHQVAFNLQSHVQSTWKPVRILSHPGPSEVFFLLWPRTQLKAPPLFTHEDRSCTLDKSLAQSKQADLKQVCLASSQYQPCPLYAGGLFFFFFNCLYTIKKEQEYGDRRLNEEVGAQPLVGTT